MREYGSLWGASRQFPEEGVIAENRGYSKPKRLLFAVRTGIGQALGRFFGKLEPL